MKIFFFAAVVAIFCVQALHGTPVATSYHTETTKNGGTTVTKSSSTTGGSDFTFGDFGGTSGGQSGNAGSFSYKYSSSGGKTSGGSSSGQIKEASSGVGTSGGSFGGQTNGGSFGGQTSEGSPAVHTTAPSVTISNKGGQSGNGGSYNYQYSSSSNTGSSGAQNSGGSPAVHTTGPSVTTSYNGGQSGNGGAPVKTVYHTQTTKNGGTTVTTGGSDFSFEDFKELLGGQSGNAGSYSYQFSSSGGKTSEGSSGGKTSEVSSSGQTSGGPSGGQISGGSSAIHTTGGSTTTIKGGSTTTTNNGSTTKTGSTTNIKGQSGNGDSDSSSYGGHSTTKTGGSTIAGGSTITGGSTTKNSTITTTTTITKGGSTTTTTNSGSTNTTTNGGSTNTTTNGGSTTTTTNGDSTATTATSSPAATTTGESVTTSGGPVTTTTNAVGKTTESTEGSTIITSPATGGSVTITNTSESTTPTEVKKPCGCGGGKHVAIVDDQDFVLNFDDLASFNIDDYATHSGIIQNDCEKRVAEINDENDNLTQQLDNCYITVSSYADEKRWALQQLETCRDEVNCKAKAVASLNIDINGWMKKYKVAYDEATRARTSIISLNAELLAYKTKAESLYIENNNAVQINIQNTEVINEYTTTITNLHQQISDHKIEINNLQTESGEWQKKYETEVKRSDSLLVNIDSLETTIADLRSTNDKVNSDLSYWQQKNHDSDVEIDGYKNNIADMTIKISNATNELNNCEVKFASLTYDYNQDELDDVAKEALLEQTFRQLSECTTRADNLDTDYHSEKTRANNLGEDIIAIRAECQAKYIQYDSQIDQLTTLHKSQLDKCHEDVEAEQNTITSINTDLTNTRNELVDVNRQLTISIQGSAEWELKSNNCDSNTVSLNGTIEILRNTIETTKNHLDRCVENSDKLQGELTESQTDYGQCEENLSDAKKKIDELDVTIDGLKSDALELTDESDKCKKNYERLRCSVNKLIPTILQAGNNAKQKLIDAENIIDNSVKDLTKYADDQDLTCPTCDVDAPCIKNALPLESAAIN